MAYITQTDLAARYASLQWWTDDSAAGAIDAAKVAESIALAEAKINAAAGQQYEIPLRLSHAATAAIVRDLAGSLAGYLLASRISVDNVPNNLRTQFEDATKALVQLAAGKVFLDGETVRSVARPAGGIVVGGSPAVVTRDAMDGL